ncbi:TPA: DUF551 domain-containing protein [Salmonella enterica]|nr:DUF551 domain-containing protein [Salmonella enterica]
MNSITKERIELFIKNPLDNGLTRGEQMEVARIVLASLEAEPIAWECGENIILFNPDTVEAYAKRAEITPKPLYAAPPVSVTPGGWISCSERMPEQGAYISAVSKHGEYVAGQVIDDWLDLHDGTSFGLDEVYLWMMLPPLPASPQQ